MPIPILPITRGYAIAAQRARGVPFNLLFAQPGPYPVPRQYPGRQGRGAPFNLRFTQPRPYPAPRQYPEREGLGAIPNPDSPDAPWIPTPLIRYEGDTNYYAINPENGAVYYSQEEAVGATGWNEVTVVPRPAEFTATAIDGNTGITATDDSAPAQFSPDPEAPVYTEEAEPVFYPIDYPPGESPYELEVAAFVRELYRTLLGREPEGQSAIDYWVYQIINNGASEETVRQAFLDSAEYHQLHPEYDTADPRESLPVSQGGLIDDSFWAANHPTINLPGTPTTGADDTGDTTGTGSTSTAPADEGLLATLSGYLGGIDQKWIWIGGIGIAAYALGVFDDTPKRSKRL